MTTTYQYDSADNRTNVTAMGSWISRTLRTGDFNGDGRGDILWQSDDGTVNEWLAQPDGSFVKSQVNTNPGTSWHVVGMGDFNGDGRGDVLLQNDDGSMRDWLGQPDGGFAGNAANFSTNPGTSWHDVGIGDFNGDGRSDVLWQNSDGTVTEWLGQPNGSFVGNPLNVNQGPGWHVAATGDFNGDGRTDVVWQSDSGQIMEWVAQANGTFAVAQLNLSIASNQHVIAGGDFNCDGYADLLLRDDSGILTEWNGSSSGNFTQNASVNYNVDTSLKVALIGNFNGPSDRCDDIVWRSSTGAVTEWLGSSSGTFTPNGAANSSMPINWSTQPQ